MSGWIVFGVYVAGMLGLAWPIVQHLRASMATISRLDRGDEAVCAVCGTIFAVLWPVGLLAIPLGALLAASWWLWRGRSFDWAKAADRLKAAVS